MPDPLMEALSNALRSPQRHRTLALQADANGDRGEAVRQFRLALELEPEDADLQLSLGMALDRAGRAREALVELEAALRLDPRSAQANYNIASLLERAGRDAEAIERYAAAAERAPESIEALLRLADAYTRTGRADAALPRYRQVLAVAPDAVAGRFGEAMALVHLGRHREARDRFAAGRERHPDQPAFAIALARLLAASPDARVRNGPRAAALAQTVVATVKTTGAAETMAMALAEVGQFAGAVEWQRLAIDVARRRRAQRPGATDVRQPRLVPARRALPPALARRRARVPPRPAGGSRAFWARDGDAGAAPSPPDMPVNVRIGNARPLGDRRPPGSDYPSARGRRKPRSRSRGREDFVSFGPPAHRRVETATRGRAHDPSATECRARSGPAAAVRADARRSPDAASRPGPRAPPAGAGPAARGPRRRRPSVLRRTTWGRHLALAATCSATARWPDRSSSRYRSS